MIVEEFHGVINFVSKWRKGTSFFFTIGIEDYKPDEQNEELVGKRILVADDEEHCLESIVSLMNKA